ncbi:MAG TPA: glycosyltransferase family 39 protein [Acidobacteriaceae bacterium]|nr:glycosyltransferase family 39 protein [Acidobacteriaceae bacterium]
MIVLEGVERKPSISRRIGEFVYSQPAAVWVTGATLLAFLIRFIVVCCVFRDIASPLNAHADFGYEMGWTARCIFLGHGFSGPFQTITGPTAIVPPLYPYLLAGIFKLFGLYTPLSSFVALFLNAVLSSLTCIPIYGAARESSGERLARWAAIGWAIYPFAIYFSAGRVWDYALTSFLFACLFWWAMRLHRTVGVGSWLLFGLVFGITALSNPSVASILPFLLLIAVHRARQIGVPSFKRAMIAFAAFAVVILPWTIRNQRVLHMTTPLRDGFWLELYAGNIGDPADSNSPYAHPASNPDELALYAQMGEPAYMAQKHDLAIAAIRQHKRRFVEASVRRFFRYWTGYWSFNPGYLQKEPFDIPNVPFCTTLSLFLIAGLITWRRNQSSTLLPFALLLITFPIPYYLTHASMDYRQPIEPELAILVTAGMLAVRDRVKAHATEPIEMPASDLDLVPS